MPQSRPSQLRANKNYYEKNKKKICANAKTKYQKNAEEIKRKRRERYARQKEERLNLV